MKLRLRLLLASALAALTIGPWSYSIWLTNGTTYPVDLIGPSGTTVAHAFFTVTNVKRRTRWTDLRTAIVTPAIMGLPPGRTVETTGTGPFNLRMRNVDPALAPGIAATSEGRSAATIIEMVRPPASSSAVPWQVVGKGGEALAFVCTVLVNCPETVRNLQAARRLPNRRPIGFRLALPLLLIVIPVLAYARSRRTRES